MSALLVVVIAASVCLLFFLILRFFSWLNSDNRRRGAARRQALADFVGMHFPRTAFACREEVLQEVQGARDAGDVASRLELRARQATFPAPASLPPWEGRESTISRFVTFVTAVPFATAAGAGEQFFYSLFDGLKETPFAETLSYLAEYTGIQVAFGIHEAADHAAPAVHHLWELLYTYYHDNPLEAAKLFMASADVLTAHADEHVFSLLRHAFDAGHLHIYGEAMAPVLHPIADSLSHSFATAHEHLSHIDIHSFAVPHDAAIPHFHFPFITIALSATREIRLLSEEKTTIGTSLANASLDVAGTSVGGFGGAKVGAIVGSFIAPGIGTIIGGALGGLLGAFGGRYATNTVKEIPLKRASETYDQKFASMESETTAGAHRLYNGAGTAISLGQQRYLTEIGRVQPLSEAAVPLGADVKKLGEDLRSEFRLRRERLVHAYQQSLELVPSDSWYHHLLGGAGAKATNDQLRNVYSEKDKQLQLGESQIPTDAACISDPLGALQQLAHIESPCSDKYEDRFIEATRKIRLTKVAYLSNLLIWARNAAHHYQEAMKNAQASISADAQRFQALCEKWMRDVQAAKADVEVELAKLGRA